MPAATQDVNATRLMGVSVNRVSGLAWGIGGGLAAVGGILVTPRLGAIDSSTFTLYVIQSFAAALIGGLRNLPRTALGALALGLIQSLIGIIPGVNSIPGLKFSTAFVFIVGALLMRPDLARTSAQAVTERAVHLVKGRGWTYARWALYGAIGLFLLFAGLDSAHTGWFGDTNRFHWAEVFADACIFLSLVVLTGFVGQISLCQATFAGFGGFFAAIFVTSWGIPFLFAIPLAALCTAPLGALVGIPALRIRGLQLAVVTLAFAVVGDQLFFAQSFPLSGGPAGRQINGAIGGIDVTGDLSYRQLYWIFLGTLLLLGGLVGALKRSPSGRAFFAVRDSEDAATAAGVSLSRIKLGAFALSAFIAAVGGGMYALTVQTVSGTSFHPGVSIQYLALVILAGIRSVWGALVASVFLIWGPTVIAAMLGHFGFDSGQADNWQQLLSGLLLILTVILNPRGIVGSIEEIPSQLSGTMRRLRERRRTAKPAAQPVEA
jgi:ABC-type branched-subunit amino acid transport system permease subunit